MSLTLEPLDDADDSLVVFVQTLRDKLSSPDLSLVKYLTRKGFVLPEPFVCINDAESPMNPIWDPPPAYLPAIMLFATTSDSVTQRATGDERWPFTVLLKMKFELRDGNQLTGIRIATELLRTLFVGWRPGTLDPLSTIDGMIDYRIRGPIAPLIAQPTMGVYMGYITFEIEGVFNRNILG